MVKEHQPRRLDVRRFAEEAAALEATEPLADFPRLLEEARGEAGGRVVHWKAHGELRHPRHVDPQPWIHLEADAQLPLVCQRCLQPVDVGVSFSRSFRFAADEAAASAEDDDAEEDVLALSRAFDLPALVEDEILMDLPVAPRHVVCPVPVTLATADPEFEAAGAERPNPFAALEALKRGRSRE